MLSNMYDILEKKATLVTDLLLKARFHNFKSGEKIYQLMKSIYCEQFYF